MPPRGPFRFHGPRSWFHPHGLLETVFSLLILFLLIKGAISIVSPQRVKSVARKVKKRLLVVEPKEVQTGTKSRLRAREELGTELDRQLAGLSEMAETLSSALLEEKRLIELVRRTANAVADDRSKLSRATSAEIEKISDEVRRATLAIKKIRERLEKVVNPSLD